MANPKKIIKAVKKITAEERGYSKTKSGRKEMKNDDIFINRVGKGTLKRGQTGIGVAPKSVSVRPKGPKVPVKRRGK